MSRAAERTGLSQPAMSHALHRLRDTLGDELLVRRPGGYQLTPRAERIQLQLSAILAQLDTLFGEEAFDPQHARETFCLAGTDYAASVFAPALTQQLLSESPQSSVSFKVWHEQSVNDVEEGLVDIAFYGLPPHHH